MTFRPAWFLRGPHAQTVWGRLSRPRRLVKMRREVIETPDGDELVLDHLVARSRGFEVPRPLRQPRDLETSQPRNSHFLLLHGLEGSSNSVYIQGLLGAIERHGASATAMNFRSCARDPRALSRMLPNRRPRFYHSGETQDFDFVARTLAARHPDKHLVAVGASLGGNALLKWLGENPGQTIVAAAAAFSVPFDLGAGARHLEHGSGRIYVARFLGTLKKKVVELVERFPEMRDKLDVDAALRSRTFRELDDAATAPIHGFADADDYYAQSSSLQYLPRITTPTLVLNAEDDPFLPREALERARAAASAAVDFRTTECGGHTGFIGGTFPWRCEYWAEELIVEWLLEK